MTSSSERVIVNESHFESVLRLTADPALLSDLSMTLVSNSPAVKLSVRRTPSQIAVIYDCKRRGSGLVNGMISRRSMAGVGPMLVLSWVKVCSGGPVQGFDVKYGIKEIVKDGRTEVSILEDTWGETAKGAGEEQLVAGGREVVRRGGERQCLEKSALSRRHHMG